MRISPEQAQAIRHLAQEVAGEDARVRLFGSRLDDRARGGDIDLLLELPMPVANPALIAAACPPGCHACFMGGGSTW